MQLIPDPFLFLPLHEGKKTRLGYEARGTVGLDKLCSDGIIGELKRTIGYSQCNNFNSIDTERRQALMSD